MMKLRVRQPPDLADLAGTQFLLDVIQELRDRPEAR